jgi:hypothetical protein
MHIAPTHTVFTSPPGGIDIQLDLSNPLPTGTVEQALDAAHLLAGQVAVIDAGDGSHLVGALTSVGNSTPIFGGRPNPASLYAHLHDLAANPNLAAVTWEDATYVPLAGVAGGDAVTGAGSIWRTGFLDDQLVIGEGIDASSDLDAIKAAAALSAGAAGAFAVLRHIDPGVIKADLTHTPPTIRYSVHEVRQQGTRSTRLENEAFDRALEFEDEPFAFRFEASAPPQAKFRWYFDSVGSSWPLYLELPLSVPEP